MSHVGRWVARRPSFHDHHATMAAGSMVVVDAKLPRGQRSTRQIGWWRRSAPSERGTAPASVPRCLGASVPRCLGASIASSREGHAAPWWIGGRVLQVTSRVRHCECGFAPPGRRNPPYKIRVSGRETTLSRYVSVAPGERVREVGRDASAAEPRGRGGGETRVLVPRCQGRIRPGQMGTKSG